MLALFPGRLVSVSDTRGLLVGVARSCTSFTQMAKAVEDAQAQGAIHFRAADEDGTKTGRKIGADPARQRARLDTSGNADGSRMDWTDRSASSSGQ